MDTHDFTVPIELDTKGWPTKAWLEQAYLEYHLSTPVIAQIAGRAPSKIWAQMKKHGIPLRTPPSVDRAWLEQKYVVEKLPIKDIAEQADVQPARIKHLVRAYGFPSKRPILRTSRPTREWVIQKYVVEDLSAKQICEITGYSKTGFTTLLASYSIPVKGRSLPRLSISYEDLYQLHVVEGLTAVRIAERLGCEHTSISRLIRKYDLDPGHPLVNITAVPPVSKDELWKLYWVDMLSISAIAKEHHVSTSTANRWFKLLDVPTRKWNGGEVHRTYTRTESKRLGREFNAYERSKILDRDSNRCQMPGCSCTEAWRLEVHHILPIEYGGDNAIKNGITLCKECHSSIRNRELEFIPIFKNVLNQ